MKNRTVFVPTVSAGVSLLNNLRVQCESAFGAGVLAHVMLSGSDSDRMNCALSLPLVSRLVTSTLLGQSQQSLLLMFRKMNEGGSGWAVCDHMTIASVLNRQKWMHRCRKTPSCQD